MPHLNTAGGAIDTTDLGVTLMHEHIFVMTTEILPNYPEPWGDETKRIDDAIARLNELKSRGVDTIVDLTVIGLGRYIPRIARIAAETELNIVVATGLYTYNDLPFYFHYIGPGTELGGPETMTDMFVRDIEQGIADTGIKASILKCATDKPGVTPGVERVLRAVAQAHRRTGVPISTHTHAGTRRGLEQQRMFAEEGVDLSRVVIGHSGDTTDLDYLSELTSNGSYLGMDRFGLDAYLPLADRVDTVARMCERGHADKMVGVLPSVPRDFAPNSALSDAPLPDAVSPVWKSMASGGSTGRPKLIEAGGDSRLPAAAGSPLGAQGGDVQLISVPLSHNTGFTTFAIGLIQGHHLVLMPRFEPREFLELVTKHRATFLATVPTIMQRLLPVYRERPQAYDLSSIRRFWHLASACPPAIKQAWIDLLGPEVIWELYADTELQALTFINGTQWLAHRGSVGIVVAGQMKVLDDDGNECPPGVVGEISMRPWPGAPRHRAGRRARRRRRRRIPGRTHRLVQGASLGGVQRYPAARRRGQGTPVRGSR